METINIKNLKRAYREIVRSVGETKDRSDWVRDNFHIIDKRYRSAKSRGMPKGTQGVRKAVAEAFENTHCLTEIGAILSRLSDENRAFTILEIRAIPDTIAVCAIIKLAQALRPNGEAALIPELVKLLISLGDIDISELIPSLWKPETILARTLPEYESYDAETKDYCRDLLARYAKRLGKTEFEAAEQLESGEDKNGSPIEVLFAKSKTPAIFWGITATAVFFALMATAVAACGVASLLFILPVGAASLYTADFIASLAVTPERAPRIKQTPVSDDAKTLVAVAALLGGGEADERIYESLSRFAYMHPDKNIFFCLLADLPDSANRYNSYDVAVAEKARTAIDALNKRFDGRFCLFLRERVLNESEGTYGGWERKRGAVCELVSRIKSGVGSDAYYGGEFIKDIKYLLTLDSDTNLSVGSVNELLSVALHPLNRPIISNGRVIKGYGIIQPAMRTELKSAYATGFSRLCAGDAGADRYASASFRRSQDIFGVGSFCGKGLIDVDVFYRCVCDKLPEGLVLSHDVIEGGIVRTLCVSDISLTDSTPKNPVSYFRRQHRWMRGDFQNLYFLPSKIIPNVTKARLALSALRHACPLFAVIAVSLSFSGVSDGFTAFILAYSYIFLPNLLYAVRYLLRGSPFAVFRYFSRTGSVLLQICTRTVFELSSSCRQAFLVLHAYILSAYRMYTRKKTLEWTTAAATEKLASGLGKYVLDGLFSLLFGLLLLIVSPIPFTRFAGLMYFIYPLISVVMSKSLDGGGEFIAPATAKQKEIFRAHARDMWRFYSDNVSERTGWLPPDNIQLSPVTATAMRTSPTNIGFYLVSVMTANDFGFIKTGEMYERLKNTLETVQTLDKYKGNLFNWYDLNDLKVIGGDFVSSVDSGNFLVMLSALKRGLFEREQSTERDGLIAICDELLCNADLSVFYDEKRDLFRIGCHKDGSTDGINRYDMLMSEMRMTSYYAVASGTVPKKHWQRLGRTVTSQRGYLGMLSWSGTAFEYLMPQLFLPLYRDSFIYESLAFAVMTQRSEHRIWGVSESAFYSFNSEMHYQYKANGIQSLALRRCAGDENVISPYSSYLASTLCPSAVLKNLDRLAKKGMYGKYGMYEALDMNDGNGLAVKSYMAHHVGMSMIACLNVCRNGIFVKRFMSDGRMDASSELLTEAVPSAPHIFKGVGAGMPAGYQKPLPTRAVNGNEPNLNSPLTTLINRGSLTAVVSDIGHIGLMCGEKLLAHTEYDRQSPRFTPYVLFLRDGKAYGCSPIMNDADSGITRYLFERGKNYAAHIAAGSEFSGRVKYGISKSCDCFIIETRAEAIKKYDLILAFEPVLETRKRYLSHISFTRLFLESEYDESQNIIYFHRRSGENGRHIFTLAVAPRDKKERVKFTTSADCIPASSLNEPKRLASVRTDGFTGACVTPYCILKLCGVDGGHTAFLVACGETKEECSQSIRAARCDLRLYDAKCDRTADRMLCALLYGIGGKTVDEFSKCGINNLWGLGISGDYPIISVIVKRPAKERISGLVSAFLMLARAGVRCDLLLFTADGELYGRPAERSVREGVAQAGGNGYLGGHGGIFILRTESIGEPLLEAIKRRSCAVYELESRLDFPATELKTLKKAIDTPGAERLLTVPDNALRSANGYFLEKSFTVDKSKSLRMPYSYILTGRRFSSVVTQSSLGLTFFDNAHERRITSFYGDPASNDIGERILLDVNGKEYDVCACSNEVRYGEGKAVYRGRSGGVDYTLTVTVCEKYPLKLINLETFGDTRYSASFEISPVMGDGISPALGIEKKSMICGENDCVMFKNPFGATFSEGVGFIGAHGGESDADNCRVHASGRSMLFFVGACTTEHGAISVASLPSDGFFEEQLRLSEEFADRLIPDMQFTTHNRLRDSLLNVFLPYQATACRFFARGSFYQSGGAYGFRDQLQDCMALVYSMPKSVRTHILRCCAHQYTEGCVMHWWHTQNDNGVNRGVKTKCSDDMLYLPIVVADYLEKTGDFSLLEQETRYLSSPPLKADERERYERPERSGIKESVYKHCLRALAYAEKRGSHGLIPIGSCDWNDAFSLIGVQGRGESVFTTMLFIFSAEKFLPIIERCGDAETAFHYRTAVEGYRSAIEKNAFFGDRYARAFLDDGTPIGAHDGDGECEIDILSQAWGAIIGLDKARTEKALNTAYRRLYDAKHGIFKLFDPPFGNKNAVVGYIRGYASGLRENGGQYTHGALWGALGFLSAGMTEEAFTVLSCADPATRCGTKEGAFNYGVEPYAISADIYGGERAGRGGWSWYTGAAAWYYKILVEQVIGLQITDGGKILNFHPKIKLQASVRLPSGTLYITADEVDSPTLDDKPISFPLALPAGDHKITAPVER